MWIDAAQPSESWDDDQLQAEARAKTAEALARVFGWLSDARTLGQRGLMATVVLYAVRPDLIDHATLEEIAQTADVTKQAVHKHLENFRAMAGIDVLN